MKVGINDHKYGVNEINGKHYEYDASKVTQLSKAIFDVESCQ